MYLLAGISALLSFAVMVFIPFVFMAGGTWSMTLPLFFLSFLLMEFAFFFQVLFAWSHGDKFIFDK